MPVNKSKVKILVVDDFITMRRIVIKLLQEIGYINFDQAEDGQKALAALQSADFDFVVSDWNMPNMTGLDLLKHVRKDPRLKEMPFLLITAEAKRSQILEAAQAGTDGYIVKPFTAATLMEKIDKIIARREDYLKTKNLWM